MGLIPGGSYVSQRVTYSPGDLFLMLTDGVTEVVNERDEEFGLARLEQLLTRHAAQHLSRIWELVMGEVKKHGAQHDDQSLLLLRVRCGQGRRWLGNWRPEHLPGTAGPAEVGPAKSQRSITAQASSKGA